MLTLQAREPASYGRELYEKQQVRGWKQGRDPFSFLKGRSIPTKLEYIASVMIQTIKQLVLITFVDVEDETAR